MTRAITAGVDSSEHSDVAADWAAREAVRRSLPLRLVNAWGLASPLEPIGRPDAEEHGSEILLGRVRDTLSARYPELDISADSMADGPVGALLEAGEGAEMLVLGSRGLGRVAGFLLGSVSLVMVSHATCPVVVVRAGGNWTEASGREVVVGVKRPGEPDAEVLEFARRSAAGRDLPLRAVHAPAPGGEAEAQTALDTALGDLRETHPRTTVASGKAVEALLQATADAELVVVGRGGRRAGGRAPVGPVTHALLHHAQCPVAVVPHT